MAKHEVILLLSGGIDSTTLLAELTAYGKHVHALSFDYGQRHNIELEFAKRNADKYKATKFQIFRIDYSPMASGNSLTDAEINPVEYSLEEGPSHTYVPGRNLLMLSHAAAYAEAHQLEEIFIAVNADDGKRFPDCSPHFIQALNHLWRTCPTTLSFQLLAPYIELNKVDVIKRCLRFGIDLNETFSCYAPINKKPCELCMSCVLRKKAIKEAIL